MDQRILSAITELSPIVTALDELLEKAQAATIPAVQPSIATIKGVLATIQRVAPGLRNGADARAVWTAGSKLKQAATELGNAPELAFYGTALPLIDIGNRLIEVGKQAHNFTEVGPNSTILATCWRLRR